MDKDFIDKMCLNKKLFVTYKEAQKALHYRQKRTKSKLRIYRCPYCKGYHLTSKN